MSRRTAIYAKGFAHQNPIPAACRIGNLVMTGVINGVHPETGEFPDTLEEQCAFLFEQVERIVVAAGGTMDDIIKVNVWMKDSHRREPLNKVWLAAFPDPLTRPARHTLQAALEGKRLIQCDFTAMVGP
ncbi:MAG TPA: RidA family protein [Burkholderiaceae bacterium]|jgi:2-iminobutanoate/2-iminopropanoate deaminase